MTEMFLGEFAHTVDSQRRISMPKVWREAGGRFVILPGRDKTLQVFSPEKAKEMLKKLTSSSFANGPASKALAVIGAYAMECTCDKQGRIALSQKLADYAGISDQAVLVGCFDSIQIYSKAAWDAQQVNVDDVLDVIQGIQDEPGDLESAFNQIFKG